MKENKKEAKQAKQTKQMKRAKAKRNRLIALLVVIILAVVGAVLLACKFTGVFEKVPEVSTVTLTKDGKVICEEVSNFDESFYSKKELKSFVKSEIKAYNDKAGKNKVKLNVLKVSGKTAYAKITYNSVADYEKFTGITMFAGTVEQAKEKFDFADAFVSVKEGAKASEVESKDVIAQKTMKVLVIKENVNVHVEGTILYVSDTATSMVNKNTVAIAQPDGNEDATQLTYIIYQ